MKLALLSALTAIGFVLKLILEREYWLVAGGTARLLIRVSARLLPRSIRTGRRNEWLAELDVFLQQERAAITFALGTLRSVPRMRRATRRASRQDLAPPPEEWMAWGAALFWPLAVAGTVLVVLNMTYAWGKWGVVGAVSWVAVRSATGMARELRARRRARKRVVNAQPPGEAERLLQHMAYLRELQRLQDDVEDDFQLP